MVKEVKEQGKEGGYSDPNNIFSPGGKYWIRSDWSDAMTHILETAAGVNCLFQAFLRQTAERVTRSKESRKELH